MKDNVVQFPKPKSKDDDDDDKLIEVVWVNALEQLRHGGCDLSDDVNKYYPAMALLYESIAALYMLSQNKSHPLQNFASEAMELVDEMSESEFESQSNEEIVYLDSEEMTVDQMFETIEKERSESKETVDK